MRRILLIEDDVNRYDKLKAWLPADVRLVWAKDAGVAIGVLERLQPDDYIGIMLDHDLDKKLRSSGSRFLTGRDVVDAMIRNKDTRDIPVLVHSMNPSGGAAMNERLTKAGFGVTKIRFRDLTEEAFTRWLD